MNVQGNNFSTFLIWIPHSGQQISPKFWTENPRVRVYMCKMSRQAAAGLA